MPKLLTITDLKAKLQDIEDNYVADSTFTGKVLMADTSGKQEFTRKWALDYWPQLCQGHTVILHCFLRDQLIRNVNKLNADEQLALSEQFHNSGYLMHMLPLHPSMGGTNTHSHAHSGCADVVVSTPPTQQPNPNLDNKHSLKR